MSSIITIRHSFSRNGLLKHRDLPHIWKAPEFCNCRPLLLSLLQHFEVCPFPQFLGPRVYQS
jgi:hypothetical protein